MWYVVQVTTGNEAKACALVERAAAVYEQTRGVSILKECFVPTYQCEQKFRGEYRIVTRNLFPGYVIAVSKRVTELNTAMSWVSEFTKILGTDEMFIPLNRNEAAFINSFTTSKRRVIRTSRAVAEGDTVRVMEGPLVGHEGWITEINRRKGTARIEAVMFGQVIRVEIGLAVVGKTE